MTFFPLGNFESFKMSFLWRDFISSNMTFFYISDSYLILASLYVDVIHSKIIERVQATIISEVSYAG